MLNIADKFCNFRVLCGEQQMTLLIILACVFGGVALMVVFGEKFGKPIDAKQQGKYSKIIMVLVFISLIMALFKTM